MRSVALGVVGIVCAAVMLLALATSLLTAFSWAFSG